jgi:hypothetical protein
VPAPVWSLLRHGERGDGVREMNLELALQRSQTAWQWKMVRALLLAVAALLVLAARLEAAPLRTSADFDALKRIPTIDVVRDATLGATVYLMFEEKRAGAFAKIEAEDPDLRALIWLAFLHARWGGVGQARKGLHTFFFMYGGDFAPQVLQSLQHAKLEREAATFAKAMALFGPRYPLTMKERAPYFAWSKPGRRVNETTTIPNDLNAFDRALMDEGDAFGSRQQFGERIAAYVERTPSLVAWTDSTRDKMSEQDRLNLLLRRLTVSDWESARSEIAAWPKPYRQLFLLHLFNEEMLNGGVHQFFVNSSGDFAPEVVSTMRDVGLPRHADAVQRAIDMFEKPYPSDRNVRHEHYFAKKWSDWDEKLNAPTGEVDDGEIITAMLAIAKQEGLLPR